MRVLNRENQAIQLTLAAIMLLGLAATDGYLCYVKPGMRPWLLAAGAVLGLLAVARVVEIARTDRDDASADRDDHSHGGGNLPWLLVLPFLAVIVVTPAPLGAYTATRQSPRIPPPPADVAADYPPLPDLVDGAHNLTLAEFVDRALYDTDQQMSRRPIRLIGFVAPARTPARGTQFLLTRFILSCCAGDASPIQVRITGLPDHVPPPDTWVAIEGTWHPDATPSDDQTTATLLATSLSEIPQPTNPYLG